MTPGRNGKSGARRFGRAVAWLLGSLWFACAPAQADMNLGSMFSDLWWNRLESGWGVTVDHEDQVMFITLYVYRSDNSPYWVVAVLDHVAGSRYTFTGDLFETRGPWFGGPFSALPVTSRKAGTATFTATEPLHATLTYSVDGTPVSKAIERQVLRDGANFTGTYAATLNTVTSNCANPADNNDRILEHGQMTIAHSGASLRVAWTSPEAVCTFDGTYGSNGALGSLSATLSCGGAGIGTFNLTNMQWTIAGMTATVGGRQLGCDVNGVLVGATTR
jgi:hypothetical protein